VATSEVSSGREIVIVVCIRWLAFGIRSSGRRAAAQDTQLSNLAPILSQLDHFPLIGPPVTLVIHLKMLPNMIQAVSECDKLLITRLKDAEFRIQTFGHW
jgi:hypothetical protein